MVDDAEEFTSVCRKVSKVLEQTYPCSILERCGVSAAVLAGLIVAAAKIQGGDVGEVLLTRMLDLVVEMYEEFCANPDAIAARVEMAH